MLKKNFMKKMALVMVTLLTVLGLFGCGSSGGNSASNAKLKSLAIQVSKNEDGTTLSAITVEPKFSSSVTDYTVAVDADVMTAKINAVAEESKAVVSVDGVNATTGLINIIGDGQVALINVTSEDEKETKTYKVTFKFKTSGPVSDIPANKVRIHYKRTNGDYTNWTVWGWNDIPEPTGEWPNGYEATGTDDYGVYYDITLASSTPGNIGFLFVNKSTETKDGGDKSYTFIGSERELWCEEGSSDIKTAKPSNVAAGTFRIHYKRTSGVYTNWTIWSWGDTVGPTGEWPHGHAAAGTDSFGAFYDLTLTGDKKNVGFVVVDETLGDSGKDGGDKSFPVANLYNEVYIFEGDNNVYITEDKQQPFAIISGQITGYNEVTLNFTIPEAVTKDDLQIVDIDRNVLTIDKLEVKNGMVAIETAFDIAKVPLGVTYKGKRIAVKADGAGIIDAQYSYTGNDLGATYDDGAATIKLWAPLASKVVVDLYSKTDSTKSVKSGIVMVKGERGVWSVTLNSDNTGVNDLAGYFYQFRVTNDGVEKKALDPYAKSMAEFKVTTTGEGTEKVGKAAIVNPANTAVAGLDFANLPSNWKREDAVIWEIHVRDFTSQEGLSLTSQFGTYSAFKEKLNYLKSLGVTHIQLLPIMSYYYGDESKAGTRETSWMTTGANYNWGYDPHSYFAPEGMYATDRTNAEARIKEIKELIKAIHDEGMAVTLDVVYNHMATTDIMNNIYPNYYYRAGKNASGCGNDTASENAMMRKIIVDSLKYWTQEYKVDGFRFDLMGIIDTETMQQAYNEVAEINPKTLFIGEGWRMYSGPAGTKGADQDWMDETNDVAVFSDEFRNALKSGYGAEGYPRFLTNGKMDISLIMKNIKAQPGNFTADDPGDVVQYIEAHDNLTLHDVIIQSMVTPRDGSTPLGADELTEEKMHKRVRMGNAIILTSQGISFLHAGQEYGRTKEWKGTAAPAGEYTKVKERYFIHNSYDSSDAVNAFDWKSVMDSTTIQNKTMNYTKGLIALRNSTDAFRLGTKALVDSNVKLEYPASTAQDKIIAYSCKATNGDVYYVIVNADITSRAFTIAGLDSGTVLVDDDESGTTPVTAVTGATITSSNITVDPLTVIVIKK